MLYRLFSLACLLLTLILHSPATKAAQTEGVIMGRDIGAEYNVIRLFLDEPVDLQLRELGLKAHLHKQIIDAIKGRNNGKLIDENNHYLVAVVKNSNLWGLEYGPVTSPYRVHTAKVGKTIGQFTWTGRAIQSVDVMDRWPTRFSRVSSDFSKSRIHPISGVRRPHNGIDLKAATGTSIWAPASGKVTHIGRISGYGKTIKIRHAKGYSTLYAHLSSYEDGLSTGDTVRKGETIGYVGNTGQSTGSHLHYEVRIDGTPRNPRTVRLLNAKPQLSGAALARFNEDKVRQKEALKAARLPLTGQ